MSLNYYGTKIIKLQETDWYTSVTSGRLKYNILIKMLPMGNIYFALNAWTI